jgi:hyperosmotically inducible periplasmic protein
MNRLSIPILLSALLALSTSSGSFAADADNSKQNDPQFSGKSATAQNQSNKRLDVKLVGKIRRHIMADKALSMNAKNIKIIDQDGVVVLRGPVDSPSEKTTVEGIASDCCGNGNFRSEIEVKASK